MSINLGLYQNVEEGYIMTFREVYIEILDTVYEYFRNLGISYWTVSTEARLTADGIVRQIDLFGSFAYNGKKWKRFA